MNNIDSKTEVLCLSCSTVTRKERLTERQRDMNPKGIVYCPVCNDYTNHMRVKKLYELLEKLGVPKEKNVKCSEEKGRQFVKK